MGPPLFEGEVRGKRDGGIAQLGEHLLCKQGVIGSNPIISTKIEDEYESPGWAFIFGLERGRKRTLKTEQCDEEY